MITCGKCKQTLDESCFAVDHKRKTGFTWSCKPCRKDLWKAWSEKNREKLRARDKENQARHNELRNARRRANRDEYNQHQREERAKNKAWYREYWRKYREKKIADPQFRVAKNLRDRLYSALRRKRGLSNTAISLLGCSLSELCKHLESQFQPGMTWDNYGEWHVDHRIPLSWFDLTNPDSLRFACEYMNLQPMWAKDNFSKRDKLCS